MSHQPSYAAAIERLIAHFGSQNALARNLGVPKQHVSRWRAAGFIPEIYALDVHDLRVTDERGPITAIEVLAEAREARVGRLEGLAEEEG